MPIITPWLAVGIAFLHGLFVVVGIYVALNTRLVRIETKLDILWARWLQVHEQEPGHPE